MKEQYYASADPWTMFIGIIVAAAALGLFGFLIRALIMRTIKTKEALAQQENLNKWNENPSNDR
jgi:hypothetical protein